MHQKEQNKRDINLTKEVKGLYMENKTVAREMEDQVSGRLSTLTLRVKSQSC